MPDRIVRDELLTSDRWIGLPDNADRLAFLALLLTADGLGNAEGGVMRLFRLWRDFGIERDDVELVVHNLAAADLIRPYEYDGKCYVHVPRFRQTTRYTKLLHPLSPWTTDVQKQALAKSSHSEPVVGTMIPLSVLSARAVCSRDDVGVGVGADVGVGVGVGVGVDETLSRASREASDRPARKANGHDVGTDLAFVAFWKAYPKKRSKGDAEKVWAKLKPSSELVERIMSALTRATTCKDWTKDDGRFIPHPDRWLKSKGWDNDVGAGNELKGLV